MLFNPDPIKFDLPDSDITYYPKCFSEEKSQIFYEKLLAETPWQQDDITVFGKTYPQPRLTALYANNKNSYTYSNITMQPHIFSPIVSEIKSIA